MVMTTDFISNQCENGLTTAQTSTYCRATMPVNSTIDEEFAERVNTKECTYVHLSSSSSFIFNFHRIKQEMCIQNTTVESREREREINKYNVDVGW
jgi:hypothetical protein